MRTKYIIYVHEQSFPLSALCLLQERLPDFQFVDVIIDINACDETTAKMEEILQNFNPDVIISEGLAAFFVHPLCGYNRICVNARIHPSLRCDKTHVKKYRDMERTQLANDRSQDLDDGTYCWGVFGMGVERRDFAMMYYPNIMNLPREVKSVADVIDECVELVQMIAESNKIDEYGVHFSEYGRVLVKADYALFRGIEKYDVPDGVVAISDDAFYETDLKTISIPESVTYIGKCAFRDCQQLEEVVLPSRLSTIHAGCFLNCISLKRVVLPAALTMIKTKAFRNTSLESVAIPDSITTIDAKAFDEGIKLIVSVSKLPELLQNSLNYKLSFADDDDFE